MICFITCMNHKQSYPCPAAEMYSASPLFRKYLAYAKSLHPDKIYIASAKYGLLRPDTPIEPYDVYLGDMSEHGRRIWSEMLYRQLREWGTDFSEKVIFIAGKRYFKYIQYAFPNRETRLQDMRIGYQNQFLVNYLQQQK